MSRKKKEQLPTKPKFTFAKDSITLERGHFLHMLSEAHDRGFWEGRRIVEEKSTDIWNVIEEQYEIDHLKDDCGTMRDKTLI